MNTPYSLFTIFEKYPHLFVRVSTRKDGSMRLRSSKRGNQIFHNREKFIASLPIKPATIISAGLVHGNSIAIVKKDETRSFIDNVDGLITSEKGVLLAITFADCLPVFLYSPEKEVIGLIHAGWRGLQKKILPAAIDIFTQKYSCDPSQIRVGIGPGIGKCHYEVKDDVVSQFTDYPDAISEKDTKTFLDLKQIAGDQLVAKGVKKDNIEISTICTYDENSGYFSSRRDNTQPLKTNMATFGLV